MIHLLQYDSNGKVLNGLTFTGQASEEEEMSNLPGYLKVDDFPVSLDGYSVDVKTKTLVAPVVATPSA